jgi:hypothetical protein
MNDILSAAEIDPVDRAIEEVRAAERRGTCR